MLSSQHMIVEWQWKDENLDDRNLKILNNQNNCRSCFVSSLRVNFFHDLSLIFQDQSHDTRHFHLHNNVKTLGEEWRK